jgi:DNA-binding SARP family transcriptional activator
MCLLTEAHIALEGGAGPGGIEALRTAMALGRAQGFRATPYWQPRVMSRLCGRALDLSIEVPYVQRLVQIHRLTPEESLRNPVAWPWPLRIQALGGFTIVRDQVPLTFTGKVQKRPLALLKALVAFGGREVAESELADRLWPDAAGDAAHRTFATTLHRLRALLGRDGGVRLQEGRLSLDPRHVFVDTWAFEAFLEQADQAERRGEAESGLLPAALDLYRGPFLGAEAAAWAVPARERLRGKFLRGTDRLARRLMAAGDLDLAVERYEGGLEVEDLAEEFYRGLMICHHRLGRRAQALQAFAGCGAALAAGLGVVPSAETARLLRQVRTH